MNAEDIYSLWKRLEAKYSDRDLRMARAWYAYRGDYHMLDEVYPSDPLRAPRRNTSDGVMVWNLILPIVDTHRMISNRLPQISVPPPAGIEDFLERESARKNAETRERILYASWDASRMRRKHGEAMFGKALWNNTTWYVRWDKEKETPVVYVRRPNETYPVMKRGGEEVARCIFRWEKEAEEIAEEFPEAKSLLDAKATGPCEVLEYIDDKVYGIVIANRYKQVTGREFKNHDLGFCPVIIDPASFVPDELFPPGPIDQLVHINDYLNRFQTKWGDALEECLFQPINISGDGASNVVYDRAPGAINRIEGSDIKVEPGPLPQIPNEVFTHLERINKYMRDIGQLPESASGGFEGSVLTGKGISRLQGVMVGMASESQDNTADALQKINRWILAMYEKAKPSKKYVLYSSESVSSHASPGRPKNFSVAFTPKDDIAGNYHSECTYNPFGSDWGTGLTIGMQLVQAQIAPPEFVMEMIPGLGDTTETKAAVKASLTEKMQLETDLQTMAQERIIAAQSKARQQEMQMQAQLQGGAPGGGEAEAMAAMMGGGGSPEGDMPTQIGNTTTLMPSGRPQMMGMGEPFIGKENMPLDFTAVKPFNQATDALLGKSFLGGGGGQPPSGLESEAMPGRQVVKLEEVQAALSGATNRKGEIATTKFKGQVWLVGDIAARGWTDGQIEFAITAKSDQQIIVNALPQYSSQGLLSFTVVTKAPANGVPVGGGEGGLPQVS